jgi:hypothetical protein
MITKEENNKPRVSMLVECPSEHSDLSLQKCTAELLLPTIENDHKREERAPKNELPGFPAWTAAKNAEMVFEGSTMETFCLFAAWSVSSGNSGD